ncbi:MAG TPA: hypothetical protein VM327_06925 [Candidatus Thermoplasmatota archaeon]|nr:hypothetical protein [Candidatus Thermoplasmatota archaeon]
MASSPFGAVQFVLLLLGALMAGCMGDDGVTADDPDSGTIDASGEEYEMPVATFFDSTATSDSINGTSTGVARGDYNGDGIADLVVGEPEKDKVTVFFGSSVGVGNPDCTTPEPRVFSGTPGSRFGAAVAIGPFIRGGTKPMDLAIGIPGEDRVKLVQGNPIRQTCSSSGNDIFLTDQCSFSENACMLTGPRNSQFGAALSWGEFDNLALTTPSRVAFRYVDDDQDGSAGGAEAVYLHFGTAATVSTGDLRITSAGPQSPSTRVAAPDPDVGRALATAPTLVARFIDDNGDGRFTLGEAVILNVDGDSRASAPDVRLTPAGGAAGGTRVGNGGEAGRSLTALAGQAKLATVDGVEVVYWDADSSDKISVGDLRLIPVLAKAAGTFVASADPDLKLLGDLVVGAPAADATFTPLQLRNGACQRLREVTIEDAGAVFVYRSGAEGLLANRVPETLAQSVPTDGCPIEHAWTGLGDKVEANDQVGSVLSAFETRIFVGVPKENTTSGLVHVVDFGAGAAQVTTYRRAVERSSDGHGTPGASLRGEGFGTSLAPGRFFSGGRAGVAVGAPGQATGDCSANGGHVVLYEIPVGRGPLTFSATLAQSGQDYATGETSECLDQFGAALAAGDFQATGFQQLAVGSPGEDVSGRTDAGVVHVFPLTRTATSSAPVQAKALAAPADVVGFGHLLGAWNFGNDTSPVTGGFAKTVDLAVAGSKASCPIIAVFFGSTSRAMFSRPTQIEGHLDGSECTPGQATRFGALY